MNPFIKTYIETLETEFIRNADATVAQGQKAYMKNKFEFYGLKSPARREVLKPFLDKKHLPAKTELADLVKALWNKPQREYHYFAQELIVCYKKQFEESDIELFEFIITHHSWWDTVDHISVHVVGNYFKKYPKNRHAILNKWLTSGNMWLQRTSLLYQLKYKTEVDLIWMQKAIEYLEGSKEFFINKAIGWVLREYSRTNDQWVIHFVETHPKLSNLSKREALRLTLKSLHD